MADSASHTVPDAPAPWLLRAQGYILALRLTDEVLDTQCFVPDAMRASRRGPFAFAMFVDYSQTPVGPYHELLFIPGSFTLGEFRGFSISSIYVSSEASVVNGRRNWGIPKHVADFDVQYGSDRRDRIQMSVNGRPAAELVLRHYPIGVPLLTALIPPGKRTIIQSLDGMRYSVTPSARGSVRAAKLEHCSIDPELFPSFRPEHVVLAVKVPKIEMTFPVAQTSPEPA